MVVVVAVRRYRCVSCGAVIAVVPRDVEPRRHYSRPAIALALALWSLASLPAAEVRRRVSPWPVVGVTAAAEGWVSLRRWVRAGRAGRLFRAVARPVAGGLREVAARLAEQALGRAPPAVRDQPRSAQVFCGAVAMA